MFSFLSSVVASFTAATTGEIVTVVTARPVIHQRPHRLTMTLHPVAPMMNTKNPWITSLVTGRSLAPVLHQSAPAAGADSNGTGNFTISNGIARF